MSASTRARVARHRDLMRSKGYRLVQVWVPDVRSQDFARIAHELDSVKALVSDAERTAPTGQRVKFRYDWLLRDLELLRQGVASHANAPRQPRPVAPLRGDYRQ